MAKPASIPFPAVRAEAFRQRRALCPRLLPRGVFRGEWYFARVPWRTDTNASLGVSMTTGRWQDWGVPGDTGTFIDLLSRIENCTISEASTRLAEIMGMSGDPQAWKLPPRAPLKRCTACRHAWQRFAWSRACTVVLGLDDEPWPTSRARRRGWACGPGARLFEAKDGL